MTLRCCGKRQVGAAVVEHEGVDDYMERVNAQPVPEILHEFAAS
jgi:hypothetical protein